MAQPAGIVQVAGARELRRSLKAAGDDLSDLKAAHKQAAEIGVRAVKIIVPIGTGPNGGRLAASVRGAGTTTAAIIRAGKKNVPYAGAVHWGRKMWPSMISTPNPPRKRVYSFIKPRLFIVDGVTDVEPAWVAVYEKALEEALDKVKGT